MDLQSQRFVIHLSQMVDQSGNPRIRLAILCSRAQRQHMGMLWGGLARTHCLG